MSALGWLLVFVAVCLLVVGWVLLALGALFGGAR